ncbi:MAG: CHASE2 domain-containing protein [Candidatus Brevundimonas phytovorans]|nr:CHASE2 domain-containing protein [Brevundimonas sp.]WEK58481.1 MAG: CHASE2 domain-containing protein [Brevundimonas sp.]
MRGRGWRGAGLTGRRALIEWGLVAAVTALLVGWLALTPVADRADNLVYDGLIRLQDGPADPSIVIIAIDDRSLSELGRWPWPRTLHAALIERLSQARPRAVAYDVLFTEPAAAADDVALADALTRAGDVHLPLLVDAPGQNGAAWQVSAPAPDLAKAAAGLGHVNMIVDGDGVIRRAPLYMQAGDQTWPQLILPLAETARAVAAPPRADPSSGEALIAAAPEAIAYRGPPGRFRTLSFVDVLNGEVPADFLKDKLVLVGATAPGMGDRYATPAAPHGELSPGVEIQAALLQTLIEGGGPRTVSPPWVLALSLLPLALLIGGFLTLRPSANMVLGAGLIVLTLVLTAVAFLTSGLWFPPAAAVAGLALAYPLWSWRRLAAASAYMQSEVETFQREAAPVPIAGLTSVAIAPRHGDVVAKQVDTLRAALKQLRDLDRFIADALRSLPDATVVAAPDGRVLVANDRAHALFGADLGPDAHLADLFLTLGEPAWRRFVADEAPDLGDILAPEGQVLKVAAAPLTNAEGRPVGHIVRFADMTGFRVAERQREQALQLLSHDMRAPQVSILTLLDGRQDRADPAFERRIGDYARQTLDLAEGYVQLARAESQPYRSLILDLGQVLMDAADTLWPQASAKGVVIQTPDGEDEHLVQGDPALLRRLLTNLLDNALKYGPAGGVIACTLTSAEEAGRPVWALRIRDQGPGLSEEAERRLFQPFGHGDADARGSGLGLAFVRTVARRHGGQVVYEAGVGATFVLTLPRVIEAGEA